MSDWRKFFDDARLQTVEAGTALFRREDDVDWMYLIKSGQIALERPMIDGAALTLHVAVKDMAVAEASLFADNYHCDAIARTQSVVACLPRAAFLAALKTSPEAAIALIKASTQEVQTQRARIEILRLRRVADRLDAWLELNGAPSTGEWVKVAEAIGVSQPALYRELARRRS